MVSTPIFVYHYQRKSYASGFGTSTLSFRSSQYFRIHVLHFAHVFYTYDTLDISKEYTSHEQTMSRD